MNDSANTSTLQPNGNGLQNGQTNLQPQSVSGSNTQPTGSLQQNALGPEAYRNFEGLRVQTTSNQAPAPAATTGHNTPEIFFGVFVLLVIVAYIFFRKYRQSTSEGVETIEAATTVDRVDSAVSSVAEHESVKESSAPVKRVAKNKASKAKKPLKKKSTSAKRKKR